MSWPRLAPPAIYRFHLLSYARRPVRDGDAALAAIGGREGSLIRINTLLAIKGSIIAGVGVAALYGNLNDWRGDDVWPATIWAGMFWAVFFPVAGFVDLRLKQAGTARALRILAWLAILWAGAAVVWLYVAPSSSYITFPTAAKLP